MTTYTWAWLKDINTWVHITNLNNLVNVHIIMTTDACKLVSKGNVDCTEGILNNLGHLCRADVSNNDFPLTERYIVLLYLLANFLGISTNSTIIVEKLINHITWNNALRCVNKVEVFTNLKAILLDYWTYEVVHSTRANC